MAAQYALYQQQKAYAQMRQQAALTQTPERAPQLISHSNTQPHSMAYPPGPPVPNGQAVSQPANSQKLSQTTYPNPGT